MRLWDCTRHSCTGHVPSAAYVIIRLDESPSRSRDLCLPRFPDRYRILIGGPAAQRRSPGPPSVGCCAPPPTGCPNVPPWWPGAESGLIAIFSPSRRIPPKHCSPASSLGMLSRYGRKTAWNGSRWNSQRRSPALRWPQSAGPRGPRKSPRCWLTPALRPFWSERTVVTLRQSPLFVRWNAIFRRCGR